MANYTTYYNLKKPVDSEYYDVGDQNGNMEIIDGALHTSDQAIAKIEDGIAYRLGETNTTGATLAVGTYVYVSGNSTLSEGMYKVSTAIAANATLSASNCTAVSGGIANALNNNFKHEQTETVCGTIEGSTQLKRKMLYASNVAIAPNTNVEVGNIGANHNIFLLTCVASAVSLGSTAWWNNGILLGAYYDQSNGKVYVRQNLSGQTINFNVRIIAEYT